MEKRPASNIRSPGWSFMIVVLTSLLPFTDFGCKEEFPPYSEPENVLRGGISVAAPDTVEVYLDPLTGSYEVNTPIVFTVSMTNTFINLLSGQARVNGKITATSFGQAPRVFVVDLTTGDLRKPPVFQGNIAVAPGDSAIFSVLWVPYATDGTIAFENYPYTTSGSVQFYAPISFIASAQVQIFDRVQAITFGDVQFTLLFKVQM